MSNRVTGTGFLEEAIPRRELGGREGTILQSLSNLTPLPASSPTHTYSPRSLLQSVPRV